MARILWGPFIMNRPDSLTLHRLRGMARAPVSHNIVPNLHPPYRLRGMARILWGPCHIVQTCFSRPTPTWVHGGDLVGPHDIAQICVGSSSSYTNSGAWRDFCGPHIIAQTHLSRPIPTQGHGEIALGPILLSRPASPALHRLGFIMGTLRARNILAHT